MVTAATITTNAPHRITSFLFMMFDFSVFDYVAI
jgi:hypothetical protein